MVGNHHELRAHAFTIHNRLEALRQRLARGPGIPLAIENLRGAHRPDLIFLVDKGKANIVLVLPDLRRRRNISPALRPRVRIEGRHQGPHRSIAVPTGYPGCILNFLQPQHAGIQLVNSPHNLGLLARERLGAIGPAHLAPIRRDGITFAVGISPAALLIFAEAAEVVEHIEGGEGNIPAQIPGGCRAGILKSDHLGGAIRAVFQRHREPRLQLPGIIAEIHNEPAVESSGSPHAHRRRLSSGPGSIIREKVGHRYIRLGIAPEVGP